MAERVRMQGLHRLHTAMRNNGDQRVHFKLTHNRIDFDCLFLVDIVPYEFVLAAIGHPDLALVLQVHKGYYVTADFGDDYKPLAKLFDQARTRSIHSSPAGSCARSMRRFRPATAGPRSTT